jgi:2-furoyl-CoA dehydrogenase large subunit
VDRDLVWRALLDPDILARTIPGCHKLDLVSPNSYRADVSLGVGIIKGRFAAQVALSDLDPPRAAILAGGLEGPLGITVGRAHVRLAPKGPATQIEYDYSAEISGKVAAVGGRMLEGATKLLINQFFQRLVAELKGGAAPGSEVGAPWWRRVFAIFRRRS